MPLSYNPQGRPLVWMDFHRLWIKALSFPIFLKKYKYNNMGQDDIFSSNPRIYQSRISYRRDSGSNPSNLTLLFRNEWDFWAFFGPFCHKGEKREGDRKGPWNWASIQKYYKIILSSFLLWKLFQETQNEWKFFFHFENIFSKEKKN